MDGHGAYWRSCIACTCMRGLCSSSKLRALIVDGSRMRSVTDVIAAAVERGADDVHVAPDLALETASAGVEDADDHPVAALQRERPADRHALDDQLGREQRPSIRVLHDTRIVAQKLRAVARDS